MSTYHSSTAVLSRQYPLATLRRFHAGLMILIIASIIPFGVRAESTQCPELAPVYAEIGATARTLDPTKLGDVIATTISAGEGLSNIVADLRSRFPEATDPELANALIATYCLHLRRLPISREDVNRKLVEFEDSAYDAVYPNAPVEPKKEGWLYSE